jgi:hypothetical protein
VALVERHLMGGDCLNIGCVPSKAIIRSSKVYADIRDAGRFGLKVASAAEVDFPAAIAGRIGLGTLASVIHPYPTQAEAIRQIGDLYNRTKLTPGVKRLFTRFLAWRR